MEEQLPRKFGKYTLIRRLAVGGMAEIFLALHRSISGFEKLLVIKRILPNLTQDADFLKMFLGEARIAATLNHPNIVQIYDVGSIGDSYYIAMEYIHGEDLRSIVRAMKKRGIQILPLEHALQIAVGVCSSLEYAHTHRDLQGQDLHIVHRDVSPQNVIVTFTGDVKLVDFGIARAQMAGHEGDATDHGQLKGKVPYMSPEQCKGEALDRRSDIFSVGIVLFELTTGRRLFRGATEFNTLRMIVEDEYPRPSQMVENYPPALEMIVMRALSRTREGRFQTARELQAAIEGFIRDNRIAASSINLSAFMQELFADKLTAQRDALAQGKKLADVIAREEAQAQEIPANDVVEVDEMGRPISGVVEGRPGPSTSAWVDRKGWQLSRRLAVLVVVLVLVLGSGGAVLIFTSIGDGSTDDAAILSGEIGVTSTPPGAKIVLDGVQTSSTTPHLFKGLRVERTYQVKLVLDGYRSDLREVRLTAARPRDTVSIELIPSAAGIVNVATDPAGATVYFDGRQLPQTTPTTISDVGPGQPHALLLRLDDHVEESRQISVEPGEVVTVRVAFSESPIGPEETLLIVTSQPQGAEVSLGGDKVLGLTPLKRRVPAAQQVELQVAKAGFERWSQTVSLAGGKSLELSAQLQVKRGEVSPPPRGRGKLNFDAVPFCNVTIGGRSYGPTPIVNLELPAGRHRVVCTSPPIGVTKSVVVNIRPDETVRHRVKLTP